MAVRGPPPGSRLTPTTVRGVPARATGGPPRRRPSYQQLTEAERTVIARRLEGRTYAEIGEALGVSRQRAWQLGQAVSEGHRGP